MSIKLLNIDSRGYGKIYKAITLYFLLENIALTRTSVSNVGVIVSVAPFFTALLARWFLNGENPNRNFYIGFVVAMVGIFAVLLCHFPVIVRMNIGMMKQWRGEGCYL